MKGGDDLAAREQVYSRRKQILDCLSGKESWSVEELVRETGSGKRTLLSDIRALRQAGNVITIRKGTVLLESRTDVVSHASRAVLRRLLILARAGRKEGISREELLQELRKTLPYYEEEQEQRRRFDTARKNLARDLEALMGEGAIYMEGDRYCASIETPVRVQMKDRSLLELYDMLMAGGSQTAYYPVLCRIAGKIEEVLQYKLYAESKEFVPSVLLRDSREDIRNYEQIIHKLFGLPFRTRKLRIQAVNRYGNPYHKILGLEQIVYLCHTGRLYLIGEEHGLSRRSIIESSRITDLAVTDLENTGYGNPQIRRICEEMLRVSVDDTHLAVIEFEDTQDIRDSLAGYLHTRKYASLTERDGKLVYTDTVRGIDDLARMIRKYGNACRVMEDDLLKRRMIESAKRIIERYECSQ